MFENRPFKSVDDMNNVMIVSWNSVVTPADQVMVAGDFIIGGNNKTNGMSAQDIIQALNGEITLIRGNHDDNIDEYRALLKNVYDYPIVVDDFWIVSHFPMYVNMQSPYANIFGHIHSSPTFKSVSARSMCISTERLNYTPMALAQIKAAVLNEDQI